MKDIPEADCSLAAVCKFTCADRPFLFLPFSTQSVPFGPVVAVTLADCVLSVSYKPNNLNRANEEIAQVRTKAKAESAALHAGLRKEQMKVESLERALQQKVGAGGRAVSGAAQLVCGLGAGSPQPSCLVKCRE